MARSSLLLYTVLCTQLYMSFAYSEGDDMLLPNAVKSMMQVSSIKSHRTFGIQKVKKTNNDYYPRNRKKGSNFRSYNSILSLLDCIEQPKKENLTTAPILKSTSTFATLAPFTPILKSSLVNPLDNAFETIQPTVMITLAPLQPATKITNAPIPPGSIQPMMMNKVPSSPWKRSTYFPRYRKSLSQTRTPLGTFEPRFNYRGSRYINISLPPTAPLPKSALKRPPKGLTMRSTISPIVLRRNPRTKVPIVKTMKSTEAPFNPFPRERRSGYFSVAPFVKSMWRTDAPLYRSPIPFPRDRISGFFSVAPRAPVKTTSAPKQTIMPVVAPTWAPFPRYRRSRACVALSNAPLSKNSYAPLFKGSWQSENLQFDTFSPQVNLISSTDVPLIAIIATNPPFVAITVAPLVRLNTTVAPLVRLNTTTEENGKTTDNSLNIHKSPISLSNAIKVRKGRRRQNLLT